MTGSKFTERLLSLKPSSSPITPFLHSIGIHRQNLQVWRADERRQGYPGLNIRTVIRLSQQLGCSPEWLAFNAGPGPRKQVEL
jgi:hypothetical protein